MGDMAVGLVDEMVWSAFLPSSFSAGSPTASIFSAMYSVTPSNSPSNSSSSVSFSTTASLAAEAAVPSTPPIRKRGLFSTAWAIPSAIEARLSLMLPADSESMKAENAPLRAVKIASPRPRLTSWTSALNMRATRARANFSAECFSMNIKLNWKRHRAISATRLTRADASCSVEVRLANSLVLFACSLAFRALAAEMSMDTTVVAMGTGIKEPKNLRPLLKTEEPALSELAANPRSSAKHLMKRFDRVRSSTSRKTCSRSISSEVKERW
mmetsp:Transcript_39775/g.78216  ORF Transcript_39775/g.78216 Transcript_39775/m.78216 type:complete len:269 (-) Transcript_39775:56-862(-)